MNSQQSPVIYLATDHAGFEHKNVLKEYLTDEGFTVVDCGADTLDPVDDYPDFIQKAARAVSENPESARAIIFGGSGQGEAMLANRFKNVRATVFYGGDETIVTLSREHNDANILSIGARFVTVDVLKKVVVLWLNTEALSDEKYTRRIDKVEHITDQMH